VRDDCRHAAILLPPWLAAKNRNRKRTQPQRCGRNQTTPPVSPRRPSGLCGNANSASRLTNHLRCIRAISNRRPGEHHTQTRRTSHAGPANITRWAGEHHTLGWRPMDAATLVNESMAEYRCQTCHSIELTLNRIDTQLRAFRGSIWQTAIWQTGNQERPAFPPLMLLCPQGGQPTRRSR
jgi:hypothetical protein